MAQVGWLVSYRGSGEDWLRFMLTSYLTNAPVASIADVESEVPDFHSVTSGGELLSLSSNGHPQLVKANFLPRTRIMQLYRSQTAKIVYLVRDPRDVCLSLMRQLGIGPHMREPARQLVLEFFENEGSPFLRDRSGVGTWPENVSAWTEPAIVRRHFPDVDVLTVKFEELRADPAACLREILEYLDLPRRVDPADVQRAVANSTPEAMREVEQKSAAAMPGMVPPGQFSELGESNQSLTFLGDDVEAAYQRLVDAGGEFSQVLKRFGY